MNYDDLITAQMKRQNSIIYGNPRQVTLLGGPYGGHQGYYDISKDRKTKKLYVVFNERLTSSSTITITWYVEEEFDKFRYIGTQESYDNITVQLQSLLE
jgi:hypothetical protein